jgi:CRISPR-associated endonuclease Cas1
MAANKTVPQPSESHNCDPELLVLRHGVVTLFGYGIQVRVDRGHLLLDDGIGSNRRQVRMPRVGHGLRRLVVIGSNGMVSLSALRWLADQDAAFVMLDRDGSVLATTGPVRSSDAKLRRAQALAYSSGTALRITRELISQKLAGQERVARNKLLDTTTADKIAHFRTEIPTADSIATVRLIESQAASAYWAAWRSLPITFPRNDIPRIPAHWQTFGARISPLTGSPRLAVNPANALLNYLYAVLESESRLAAAALGLDPGLGVLHVDARHRDSLACDLMEPVRPQVDAHVLDWITRQPLKREWFFEQRDGNCRLMATLAGRLSETTQVWGRAVAAFAEWTAQALWDSIRKPSSEVQQRPTRLTQQRRSQGRGNDFVVSTPSLPSRLPQFEPICQSCGVTTRGGPHCRKCGKEISGKKLIELAKAGRIVTLEAAAQKKRSATQRRHQAAKREWRESCKVALPDQKTYDNEVQPRLASITIAKIASTLGISESYAADIRAGRRRPHRRHWQKLTELTTLPR